MPGLLHDHSARAQASPARSRVSWQTRIDIDRPALIDSEGALSHRQLAATVADQARRLDPNQHGRRLVHLPMQSTRAAVIGYLSVLAAGHVALVTGPSSTEIRSRYQPDGWLDADGQVTLADQAQHLLHPELALLLSTSGSTGSPKLVRLSTANLISNADAIIAALGLTKRDKTATTLPLTYCFGLSVLHSHLRAGASVVLDPTPVTDPGSTVRLASHQITTLAATPHLLEALSLQGALTGDLPQLRLISQAGGALPSHRVAEIAALGRQHGYGLAVMYGQTEATARMSVLPPELADRYPDSVGWPVSGSEFRVDPIDRDGNDLVPGSGHHSGVGELVFSGPGVMLGYANQADDLALPRTIAELPTGDLGWVDSDGLIRVTGRRSGFVKIMGIRVDLGQLERALAEQQLAACVTGDDTGLRACVATQPAAAEHRSPMQSRLPPGPTDPTSCQPPDRTIAGLRQLVAGLAGVGMASVQVRLVTQLPLLANGKLDRKTAAAGFPNPQLETAAATADRPLDQVVAALAPLLGRTDLDPDRSFAELGGDSFTHVQAATRLARLLAANGNQAKPGHHQPPGTVRLPSDWHQRTLYQLAELIPARPQTVSDVDPAPHLPAGVAAAQRNPSQLRPSIRRVTLERLRPIQLETSVVLRAAAVIMICGSHVGLFSLAGGAHILLAVAGFHYARYIAIVPSNSGRWRRTGRAVIGVGLPAIAVAVGMKLLLSDNDGGWPRALLVNSFLQPDQGSIFWFVECLLAALIVITALLSAPFIKTLAQRDLWRFAMVLGGLTLIPRYLVVGPYLVVGQVDGPVRGLPWTVAWLFVFGMALAFAATQRRRLVTVLIAVASTVGFFPNFERNLMIALGLVVLGLVLTIPVPDLLAKPVEVLSAASLYIYLIQFTIFRLSDFPPVEFAGALVAGLVFWVTAHPLVRRCQSIIKLTPQPSIPSVNKRNGIVS